MFCSFFNDIFNGIFTHTFKSAKTKTYLTFFIYGKTILRFIDIRP